MSSALRGSWSRCECFRRCLWGSSASRMTYFGALRMGVEHGTWCVACCWALMLALFALGVMSVGWMALVGVFIALEKMLPWKRLANRSVAVALGLIAVSVAFAPGMVPGVGM
ncbi:DUF2182 domain-containing protein [Arthrobacter sp. AZCC_0090]|uniref:copper chaperone n=1 Tax=Arthrobacter sp. AZCC_0090 TaxID=2735881 RepID=UPI002892B90F|nr:DUF2182 domain-containing protein [Arthrobacter sp. AZCC_0090]